MLFEERSRSFLKKIGHLVEDRVRSGRPDRSRPRGSACDQAIRRRDNAQSGIDGDVQHVSPFTGPSGELEGKHARR